MSETPTRAPVQGFSAGIPWEMHLRAYDAYCKRYGKQPAMIDPKKNCRGGFGTGELDEFIPGWRDELTEIGRLAARIEELEKALKPILDLPKECVDSLLCQRPIDWDGVEVGVSRQAINEIHDALIEARSTLEASDRNGEK